MMKEISYEELYDAELVKDAILHTHEPFIKDYLALHILLRMAEPKSVLEIGTHVGEGTNIICNAVPASKVFSLDLPYDQSVLSLQSPVSSGKGRTTGLLCQNPYTQLWGDSMIFDYYKYPCEAWYIDGEHLYSNVRHETKAAITQRAKLIIWHDADLIEVGNAIKDSFVNNSDYELYRVTGTSIAYAIRL